MGIATMENINLSVEDLQEEFQQEVWGKGIEVFKIITFYNNAKHTFLLRSLELDVEQNIIMFSDLDGLIAENHFFTLSFLKEQIYSIQKVYESEHSYCYQINLLDKIFKIYPLESM